MYLKSHFNKYFLTWIKQKRNISIRRDKKKIVWESAVGNFFQVTSYVIALVKYNSAKSIFLNS